MHKKQMVWKTKGMNKDLSVSAFNPEFVFENMNLRLDTKEGNTQMSWVNERGTSRASLLIDTNPTQPAISPGQTGYDMRYIGYLHGHPIGTAVVGSKLIVFTQHGLGVTFSSGLNAITYHDFIYQLELNSSEGFTGKLLFKGNLGFSDEYPLETLVSYESEDIQKIYWTDGINQPRVINIVGDIKADNNTQFDFLPSIDGGSISVVKGTSNSGIFAPGVIQYCFTYYNKHGQQTNVVDASSLCYVSYSDRGTSPEDKVSCSFTVTISFPDNTSDFDYVRLYSIQRTSLNATPIVQIVSDISTSAIVSTTVDEITTHKITYTDNGTTGTIIDPMELLYIGGKEIKALTMTDKDGTLFLGNISVPDNKVSVLQSHFMTNHATITYEAKETNVPIDNNAAIYDHHLQLGKSHKEISTFKRGNTYRFGFQLQRKTGEWTEPIWINDARNSGINPSVSLNSTIKLAQAKTTINFSSISGFSASISEYKNVRPLVVLPTISDREVICQGVLNPTVFNSLDRASNSPYAQASWYFRPIPASGNGLPTAVGSVIASALTNTQKYGTVNGSGDGVPLAANAQIGITEGYENDVTDVYVLVAEVHPDKLSTILKRGYFNLHKRTSNRGFGGTTNVYGGSRNDDYKVTATYKDEVTFVGAIILKQTIGETNSNSRVAFISKSPWNGNIHGYNEATVESLYKDTIEYEIGVSNPSTVNVPFPFYVGMQVDKNGLYYYVENDSTSHSSGAYQFKFYDSNAKYYEVTYNDIDETYTEHIATTDWTSEFVGARSGSAIQYQHYQPLYSTDELKDDDTDAKARHIEIQGSGGGYGSITGTISHFGGNRATANQSDNKKHFRKPTSNTEFFVDASIVTLNSPDIEFNTEVQSFDTSGLNLRVIGWIPITSTVSSHKITTSSSMLESSHNLTIKGLSDNFKSTKFGAGELSFDVISSAGKRLVSDYLWNDVLIGQDPDADDKIKTSYVTHDFLVYPWQRSGSLNNDFRKNDEASSILKTKKESNLLYSNNTTYITIVPCGTVNTQIHLTENDYTINYRLPARGDSTTSGINYYPNIDKILYNENGYKILYKGNSDNYIDAEDTSEVTSPIAMKYKSTSHAVLGLNMKVLPGYGGGTFGGDSSHVFWKSSGSITFEQTAAVGSGARLLLGELYRDSITNQFGGTTLEAIRNNSWIIGGDIVPMGNSVSLTWTHGDTYYQRYDCLKTYPFTNEDPNQIIEILSFMCETYTNIDGRYDRNRGQKDNTNMSPRNFNLLNPVYNQQDNFFTYRQVDEGESKVYPNQVCFTGTKNSSADVDEWTHITLGGTLELDGDKGQLTSLQRLNDSIIAFQEKGISQILYNESAAISTTAGVPIELGNSGKVQGKKYISNTVGCSNKWSICNTPNGIYFMDSNEKSIYLFNGQLTNISAKGGMNSWSKKKIPVADIKWNPKNFGQTGTGLSGFVSYYDRENQDVLFVNKDTALAWSEKFGTFTSFYDYGGGSYFNSLQDIGVWTIPGIYTETNDNDTTTISDSTLFYLHNKGSYCNFFNQKKPYWMTLVGNPEPLTDKVFTNLEFRACVKYEGSKEMVDNDDDDSTPMVETGRFLPTLPFDSLECWDEYQHGIAILQDKNGQDAMRHFLEDTNKTAHLDRKFRIWRCDIPRDNWPLCLQPDPSTSQQEGYAAALSAYKDERDKGIARYYRKPMDRMRNPWIYMKLMKNAASVDSPNLDKTEVHDVVMTYYV